MDNSEVIFDLIDFNIEGIDVYHHNGSLWLIFTEDKKWVIELTKDGTLWYNYYFFTNCFKYLSLDVVNNQYYIAKWVENILQNRVKYISLHVNKKVSEVKHILQNEVRYTLAEVGELMEEVEHILQNGIRNTIRQDITELSEVEDVIQNGVRSTTDVLGRELSEVEDVI